MKPENKDNSWYPGMLVVCVDGKFPLQATEWGDQFVTMSPRWDAEYKNHKKFY
jgi:hypothetical protein